MNFITPVKPSHFMRCEHKLPLTTSLREILQGQCQLPPRLSLKQWSQACLLDYMKLWSQACGFEFQLFCISFLQGLPSPFLQPRRYLTLGNCELQARHRWTPGSPCISKGLNISCLHWATFSTCPCRLDHNLSNSQLMSSLSLFAFVVIVAI